MKKTQSLPPKILKGVIDQIPAAITFWEYGKIRKNWKECVMIYHNRNEESIKMDGPDFAKNLGKRAGEILAGFEATGFTEIFTRFLETNQPQEWTFHFGNELMTDGDRQHILFPLTQEWGGSFSINITPRVMAEKAKEEKMQNLEELNQQLVERELQMIQLKSEIAELEKKI